MASVTRCDACGAVSENAEAKYVRIYHCKADGSIKSEAFGVDVCPDCYNELCKKLGREQSNAK